MKSQEIDDIRAAASSVEGATAVGENTAKELGLLKDKGAADA